MTENNTWACPVPDEQQPLNEFRSLKESGFFRWGTLNPHQYWLKAIWIWGLSWVITGPVAAASFPVSKDPFHFTLCASAGASLILILLLVRLYLGWKYIGDRLNSPTVSYEESGWYDGQIWEKSPEILTKDQLIVTYQVKPILKRLHWTFAALGTLLGAEAISWICF